MNGYYPPTKQVYSVKRNSKKNCYEIVFGKEIHRTGISTRKDANNQTKALNFRFGVVY